MTDIKLKNIFTKEYNTYKEIGLKHTVGIYEIDIVMSNLYIHLYNYKDELNEKNIMGYVVTYCYGLKRWRQNKSPLLTEKLPYRIDLVEDDYTIENIIDDENIDFIEMFNYYLDRFIYECDLTLEDKLLITDFYKYNIDSREKTEKFYGQKSTYATKIRKQIKEIEQRFKMYIINDIYNKNK